MVTLEVKVEWSSYLRAEWSSDIGVEWSSDLEVEWNLEQQKCGMGNPLTDTSRQQHMATHMFYR